MQEKFNKIKQYYNNLLSELLKEKKFPLRQTEKGYWGITSLDDVFELFKKINLNNYKKFLDLGSGDGRVVLVASLFTNAEGIEADKELFEKSKEIKNLLKINAKFYNKDFLEHNFPEYDIIFIHPDRNFYELEKKLKEFNGKLIVYNNLYKPLNMKLEKVLDIKGTEISIFSN
ncbi:hypothetical protein KY339_02815 [Candidatus Woesearchaeota archaeon]|nr:hypothetical protein [Candidatus Woesearchaeota archaeon]